MAESLYNSTAHNFMNYNGVSGGSGGVSGGSGGDGGGDPPPENGLTKKGRSTPCCSVCKNHNVIVAKKGHKCPNSNCTCDLCKMNKIMKVSMKNQQRWWRHQKHRLGSADSIPLGELSSNTGPGYETMAVAPSGVGQGAIPRPGNNNKKQLCDKCRNHDELVLKRNHDCPRKECLCEFCKLSTTRREVMKVGQRLTRFQNSEFKQKSSTSRNDGYVDNDETERADDRRDPSGMWRRDSVFSEGDDAERYPNDEEAKVIEWNRSTSISTTGEVTGPWRVKGLSSGATQSRDYNRGDFDGDNVPEWQQEAKGSTSASFRMKHGSGNMSRGASFSDEPSSSLDDTERYRDQPTCSRSLTRSPSAYFSNATHLPSASEQMDSRRMSTSSPYRRSPSPSVYRRLSTSPPSRRSPSPSLYHRSSPPSTYLRSPSPPSYRTSPSPYRTSPSPESKTESNTFPPLRSVTPPPSFLSSQQQHPFSAFSHMIPARYPGRHPLPPLESLSALNSSFSLSLNPSSSLSRGSKHPEFGVKPEDFVLRDIFSASRFQSALLGQQRYHPPLPTMAGPSTSLLQQPIRPRPLMPSQALSANPMLAQMVLSRYGTGISIPGIPNPSRLPSGFFQ